MRTILLSQMLALLLPDLWAADPLSNDVEAYRQRYGVLMGELDTARDKVIVETKERPDRIDGDLSEAVRSDSRLRPLIDGRYRLIDTRCKELLDALRFAPAWYLCASPDGSAVPPEGERLAAREVGRRPMSATRSALLHPLPRTGRRRIPR